MTDPRVAEAADSLREHGYAVLPGVVPADGVTRMRSAIDALLDEIQPDALFSKEPRWLAPDLQVAGTGLVFHGLLGRAPGLADDMLPPLAYQLMHEVLGEGVFIEFSGGVVCDQSRPFFSWHHHVGGIDDELSRQRGRLPAGERPERIAMLLYLDEIGPELGQLLVDPARRTGPPPHPVEQHAWPGMVGVAGPAGTIVFLDQVTWHAVTPKTLPGLRRFVGLWFAAADAPPSEGVDSTLHALETDNPEFAALLASRPDRRVRPAE